MRAKDLFLCLTFSLVLLAQLKSQLSIGIGSGLYLNQAYKNNNNVGNHTFLYSEALYLGGHIGLAKNNFEVVILIDYAKIPQKFEIQTPFFDNPNFIFTRNVISPSLNLTYSPVKHIGLTVGLGVLISEEWKLGDRLGESEAFVTNSHVFSHNRTSPFILIGLLRRIRLSNRIELIPKFEIRRGLNYLNSSYQSISVNIDNRPVEFTDVLYLNRGNTLILNTSIIYYLTN